MATLSHPVRPYEFSRSASFHNAFINNLYEFRKNIHLHRMSKDDPLILGQRRDTYLALAEAKLKAAFEIALRRRKIVENYSEAEKAGSAEFLHWLSFETWNVGSFLILIHEWEGVNEQTSMELRGYMKAIERMICNHSEAENSSLPPIDPTLVNVSFNELVQSFKQVKSRKRHHSTLFANFLARLRSFFESIIHHPQLVSSYASGVHHDQLKEMIDLAVESGLDDDEEDYEKKQFKKFLQKHVATKFNLGGKLQKLLLDKIELSIEMCRQYEREGVLQKAADDLQAWITTLAKRSKQAIHRVNQDNSILGPIEAALRILGWVFVQPVLAITDGIAGTNYFNQYNERIRQQWNKTPWGVTFALLGIVGLGAGITVATIASMGIAPSLTAVLTHLGWGGATFAIGFGAAATAVGTFRQAQIEYYKNEERRLIAERAEEINAARDMQLQILEQLDNPQFREEMEEEVAEEQEFRRHLKRKREQKAKAANSAVVVATDSSTSFTNAKRSKSNSSSRSVAGPLVIPSSSKAAMARSTLMENLEKTAESMTKEDYEEARDEFKKALADNQKELKTIRKDDIERRAEKDQEAFEEQEHDYYMLFGAARDKADTESMTEEPKKGNDNDVEAANEVCIIC